MIPQLSSLLLINASIWFKLQEERTIKQKKRMFLHGLSENFPPKSNNSEKWLIYLVWDFTPVFVWGLRQWAILHGKGSKLRLRRLGGKKRRERGNLQNTVNPIQIIGSRDFSQLVQGSLCAPHLHGSHMQELGFVWVQGDNLTYQIDSQISLIKGKASARRM